MEIIPSINAPTFEEVQERIAKIEPYVSWCHLDVTDGVFSKHITWHNALDLPMLKTKLNVEVHLMVENPEFLIEHWFVKPITRVIVHLEAVKDMELIIRKCIGVGKEIGLAIKPDTFWGLAVRWLDRIDVVQILAVNPGPSGQTMSDETVEKIIHLRRYCPSCIIEVDGGINAETAKKAKDAGANLFVTGSAIFNNDQGIEHAVHQLKQAIS